MQSEPGPEVSDDVAVMAGVAAFHDLPERALTLLAGGARRCEYEPGAILMRQGDASDCLHVIASGRVRVEKSVPEAGSEPVLLGELGPRDLVGEMGVLDDAPRSATVRAVERTETLTLSPDLLAVIMIQYPRVSGALLRIVSERVRNNKELTERMQRKDPSWLGPW